MKNNKIILQKYLKKHCSYTLLTSDGLLYESKDLSEHTLEVSLSSEWSSNGRYAFLFGVRWKSSKLSKFCGSRKYCIIAGLPSLISVNTQCWHNMHIYVHAYLQSVHLYCRLKCRNINTFFFCLPFSLYVSNSSFLLNNKYYFWRTRVCV